MARYFIRFHNVRHPKDMGAAEVQAFLSFLANDRGVAPSTHRQALAAILYLYKEVLGIKLLGWMRSDARRNGNGFRSSCPVPKWQRYSVPSTCITGSSARYCMVQAYA